IKGLSPKPPPASIIISYYMSPVEFCYISCQNVRDSALMLRDLEKKLEPYCTPERMQQKYELQEIVIVRYLAWNEPRMLRGQVMVQNDEEYLVWVVDYGFSLSCKNTDLWPLPNQLSKIVFEMKRGGVASIVPYNGNDWSVSGRHLFGKLLENATDLTFEAIYEDASRNTYYGKLTIRSPGNEAEIDGAAFLVERKCASIPTQIVPLVMSKNTCPFEMAEINDRLIKPSHRVAQFLQLVDVFAPPVVKPDTKTHLSKLVRDQEVTFGDVRFNYVQALGKTEKWSKYEKNERTLANPEIMEEFLLCRNEFKVPATAKRLSKVNIRQENSGASGSICDALKMPGRLNILECYRGLDSTDDSKSKQDNISKFKNTLPFNVPTSVLLNCGLSQIIKSEQPKPIKSSSISSRLIFSPSTTEQFKERAVCDMPQTTGGPAVDPDGQEANGGISLSNCVLAHSLEPTTPIREFEKMALSHTVKTALKDRFFHTLMPLQQYAWPHLCAGGSMILVNSSVTVRTWSYLPVLCSTVLNTLDSSRSTAGPLAILVTESLANASTLFKEISYLMQNHETHHTKVVNGHAYSERDLIFMLLNGFGILVTTPLQFHSIIKEKLHFIDKNRVLFVVLDDFQPMQVEYPEMMDDVMRSLNDFRNPKTQIIIITQKWQSRPFQKLLKTVPNPLILFGDFLEAAMYGKLTLTLNVQREDQKDGVLLSFLASQKPLRKLTMIYFKSESELAGCKTMLIKAGYDCIGISKAEDQQPHQLLLVSDQLDVAQLPVRNIEVLIHNSLPVSWTKFCHRFHAQADNIPNLAAPPTSHEKRISSLVLLSENNKKELIRLVDFLHLHDITPSKEIAQLAQSCHEEAVGSRPICPYYLNSGHCHLINCNKRHEFIKADMPEPGDPLMQPETEIRCKLIKTYDPAHMAMWPLQFKTKRDGCWIDVANHVSQWTLSLEMSKGELRKMHNLYRLNDVCVVIRNGQVQRVRIVDIPSRRPVVVQLMDHGSELLHIKPCELFECPDTKFANQPPMALNIRLSGVQPANSMGVWSGDSTKWTHNKLGNIGNNMHLQVTVDFALLNVIYVKEIVLIAECPRMRTSIYRVLLSKELISKGFAKVMNTDLNPEAKSVEELEVQEVAELQTMKTSPKSKDSTSNTNSKETPSLSVKTHHSPIGAITKILAEKKYKIIEETPIQEVVEKDDKVVPAQKPIEDTLSVEEDQAEDQDQSLDYFGNYFPSENCNAFLRALLFEVATRSPSKKQDTKDLLSTLLEEDPIQEEPTKPKAVKALKLHKIAKKELQGPSPEDVAASLQCAQTVDGTVNPKVKWHQDLSHITLVIEQKVPEYELVLENYSLVYMVSTISPRQCCILNLLGEVTIESEKQIGFYLHIKLAKVGLMQLWPSLLNSLYAQQNALWLVYDSGRDKEPELSEVMRLWDSFERRRAHKEEDSSSDDDYASF
ncbi:hypothetical protein KR067_009826, partial [Drosophila pandora]